MLKRVNKISNIGRFKGASCGSAEFDRISIIFGRNTYGKSTLSDLFSSLKSNDISAVETRRTIPDDKCPQEAKLSFLPKDQSSEVTVTLGDNGWNYNGLSNIRFLVFDDGFFHNNIFAARQFTRSTKENLSAFILGAEGVTNAKVIAEYKKEKGAKTREHNQLKKDAFSDIANLNEFFALTTDEPPESIKRRINELRDEYSTLKKQRDGATDILKRKTCSAVNWGYEFSAYLGELNSALSLSLESHHKEAQRKVSDHIAAHFKTSAGAEAWIREGIEQNKGELCQFCGQSLCPQAKELLSIYRESFDTAYKSHEQNVNRLIADARQKLKTVPLNDLRVTLATNRTVCASYPELSTSEDYSLHVLKMETSAIRLEENIKEWEKGQATFWSGVEKSCKKKKQSPHGIVQPVTNPDLSKLAEALVENIASYNNSIITINGLVSIFKDSVAPDKLDKRLKALDDQRKQQSRLLKRQERKEQVERFKTIESEIAKLNTDIPALEKELRDQQSQFLDDFFVSLNSWFNTFGSKDFSLEKGSDNTGHTPIYFLKVKFKGKLIPEKYLDRVFSESDRRALALAVFWAYLSGLDGAAKENFIVVLDDPVTSFDNGRITAVHQEIIKLYLQVRQVIVLSHYNVEVSKFLSTYRKNHPIVLLSLEYTSGSSTIVRLNIAEFIKNEHEQKARRIADFVDSVKNAHNAGDLRVFFEAEIAFRFARQLQISGATEAMLGEKIDKLLEHNFITKELAHEAHSWRECLNPSHHTWSSDDIEDQRKTAERFMNFIYKELVSSK